MYQNMSNSTLFVLYTFKYLRTYVFNVFNVVSCLPELHALNCTTHSVLGSEVKDDVTSLIEHAQ